MSRWNTIRYAIDNNGRTIRLCIILLASSSAVLVTLIGLVPHLVSRL